MRGGVGKGEATVGARRLAALCLLWVLGAGAAPGFTAPTHGHITLAAAIGRALAANADYLNSIDYAEMAEIEYQNARAIYRTRIQSSSASDARSGAEVGSTYSLTAVKRHESGSAFSAGLHTYNFGDISLSEFRVSYTLPIFRDPLRDGRFDVDQRHMTLQQRRYLAAVARQLLVNEVVATYYQLALAEAEQRLARRQLAIAERIHAAAEVRHQNEAIPATELAAQQLRLLRDSHHHQQTVFNAERARARLAALLGMAPDDSPTLGEVSLTIVDMPLPAMPLERLESMALDNRAEARSKRDEMLMARRRMDAATGAGPTGIDITLQYARVGESHNFGNSLTLDENRFGIGIAMDTDFGIGDQQRRQRLLTLQYQTRKRDYEKLLSNIRMEVGQARFEVLRQQALADIAGENLALVNLEYQRAQVRHRHQLMGSIPLMELEQRLEEARFQLFSARVNQLMAGQALVLVCGYFDGGGLPAGPQLDRQAP